MPRATRTVLVLMTLLPAACQEPSSTKDSEDAAGDPLEVSVEIDAEIASLARVSWEQPSAATTHVEYAVGEEAWRTTPPRSIDAGPAQALLLGIPYGSGFSCRVVFDQEQGLVSEALEAETGPAPLDLPLPELLARDPAQEDPAGRFLLGSINATEGGWTPGAFWTLLFDREGRLVWARRGEGEAFTISVAVSKDGDILQDVSTFWEFDGRGAYSELWRLKLDGTVSATYSLPWLFNPFVEMPDGSFVWGALTQEAMRLMRLDPQGKSQELWDCAGFGPTFPTGNWCRVNSIFHDDRSGNLLIALPDPFPIIMEIDPNKGEILRWFGELDGWGFDPPESAFIMPHGVTWTPSGTLLVSSQESEESKVGVIREYALDEENEELDLIWSQGEGSGILAPLGGGAERLSSGNTLHSFGTTPRVQEVSPSGEVVWDLAWEGSHLLGRVTLIEDLYLLGP